MLCVREYKCVYLTVFLRMCVCVLVSLPKCFSSLPLFSPLIATFSRFSTLTYLPKPPLFVINTRLPPFLWCWPLHEVKTPWSANKIPNCATKWSPDGLYPLLQPPLLGSPLRPTKYPRQGVYSQWWAQIKSCKKDFWRGFGKWNLPPEIGGKASFIIWLWINMESSP